MTKELISLTNGSTPKVINKLTRFDSYLVLLEGLAIRIVRNKF